MNRAHFHAKYGLEDADGQARTTRQARLALPHSRAFAGDFGDLLADEADFQVPQALFVQPIGAGNFLECVDRRLNALRPSDRDQLDVTVHIADGEDSAAAGFVIRVDRDAAVVVEPYVESLERVPRGEKTDLHDDEITQHRLTVGQRERELIAGEFGRGDFHVFVHHPA